MASWNLQQWPDDPFWRFSLSVYGHGGVEAACLELQNRHGLDVNLLLLACWLGQRGTILDKAAFERVAALVASWQDEIVKPLRAVRRTLRHRLEQASCKGASSASTSAAPSAADPLMANPGVADPMVGAWPEHVEALRGRVLSLELDAEHLEQLLLSKTVDAVPAKGSPGPGCAAANLRHVHRFENDDRHALGALLVASFPAVSAAQCDDALNRFLA